MSRLTPAFLLLFACAAPRSFPAPPSRSDSPFPSHSVCSLDAPEFVSNLRCQIGTLARIDGGTPICGDLQSTGEPFNDQQGDLRAEACGLRDRLSVYDLDYAVAQSCFNTMGRPPAFEQELGQVHVAQMLGEAHGPDTLRAIATELDTACSRWSAGAEARLDGAILGAVAGLGDEVDGLLPRLLPAVRIGVASGMGQCVVEGVKEGPASDDAICSRVPKGGRAFQALAGSHPVSHPLERYAETRFGSTARSQEARWSCLFELDGGGTGPTSWRGAWGLDLPRPQTWSARRPLGQLELDAGLRGLSDSAGSCWKAASAMLSGYTPRHPLPPGLSEESVYDADQQVCARVCEGWYGLTRTRGWYTPDEDLAACVGADARLWSPGTDVAQTCAMHLVGHGRLEGLPMSVASEQWMSTPTAMSRVAGGADARVTTALRSLTDVHGTRGRAQCADVATQCLVATTLSLMGRDAPRRPTVDEVVRTASTSRDRWCRPLQPDLRSLHVGDGDVNKTCRVGIRQALTAVSTAMMLSGAVEE